jgi:Family of unknown function (DUF5752)
MSSTEPFAVYDCSLARLPTGRSCSNLRELLEAIRTVPNMVIEHHMTRCQLVDHFELYEFPNEFARWCWDMLGDHVLAEQLGLIDPYQHASIDSLRAELVNVIDERIWELDRVPWCPPGLDLHLVGSRVMAYDTGERFSTPVAMAEALPRISSRSLFYHVPYARRRTPGRTDDLSNWLEGYGADESLVSRLRAIDVHFIHLSQLREQLIEAFRHYLPAPEVLLKVSA